MKAKDWPHVEASLQAALDRAPDERIAFLDEACADDPALRREVESLLSAYEQSDGFMAENLSQVAAELMPEEQEKLSRRWRGARPLQDSLVIGHTLFHPS